MDKIKIKFSNPESLEKAKTIANSCKDTTDGDRCEAAFKIAQCMYDKASAQGMQMDEVEIEDE